MKRRVKIVEVGPRDGFQSIKEPIPVQKKLDVIRGLLEAGIQKVQITSFVSPKAIPQMQDAEIVAKTILEEYPDKELFALVPNFIGAQKAVEAGLKELTPVISLSQSHNLANVKRTHEQSYEEIRKIRETFSDRKLTVDLATVFGCPFEGEIPETQLYWMIETLASMGIRSFTLCDTIGIAHPSQVQRMIANVKARYPQFQWNIHIHDTRNMGMINSYAAIQAGVDEVQTAVGGLGGCPFAPGATGNTATEDLVYMLEREGYETGIHFERLLETARTLRAEVNGNYSGHQIMISKQPCFVPQE